MQPILDKKKRMFTKPVETLGLFTTNETTSPGQERLFKPPVKIYAKGDDMRLTEKRKFRPSGGHDILNTVYGKGSKRTMRPAKKPVTEVTPVEEKKPRSFKPYNLYDPTGPEVRAQSKMNSTIAAIPGAVADSVKGATGLVTSAADNLAGGKGARAVIDSVKGGVSSIRKNQNDTLADIKTGNEQYPELTQSEAIAKVRNNRFVANRLNNRESNAMTYGEEGKRVFSNVPAEEPAPTQNTDGMAIAGEIRETPAVPEAPTQSKVRSFDPSKPISMEQADGGRGSIDVNMSEHDFAVKDSLTKIDEAIAGGMAPTPEQAQRIQKIREQAGFLRGGTDKRAFMPNGLPIDSPKAQGVRGKQEVGNLDITFDQNVPQSARREFMASPPTGDQPTWADGHKQWEKRQPGYVDPAKTLTPEEKDKLREFTLATEKNDIDRLRAESQAEESKAVVENNRFTLNQKQEVQQLEKEYMNAKPGSSKQKSLERQLYALKGRSQPKKQIFTERSIDPVTGEITSQNYSLNTDGKVSRLVPDQFPSIPSSKKDVREGRIYQTVKHGLVQFDGKGFFKVEIDQFGNAKPALES